MLVASLIGTVAGMTGLRLSASQGFCVVFLQERTGSKSVQPYLSLKVIPRRLFLDVVPSSSVFCLCFSLGMEKE